MHWGSITAGLPQRTEDALWSASRPESRSEVPAVVTRSPSATSGLTGNDLGESDFTFYQLPSTHNPKHDL